MAGPSLSEEEAVKRNTDCVYFLASPLTCKKVKDIFDALAPAVGLSVGLAVGQSSIADEISVLIQKPKLDFGLSFDTEDLSPALRSGVDILVATHGRLMDHINNTKNTSVIY